MRTPLIHPEQIRKRLQKEEALGDDVINDNDVSPVDQENRSFWNRVLSMPAALAIVFVRCYQIVLSPVLGRTCRFHPSCSQYYILAVRKYGLIAGSWRGVCRIARCHPWNPGGYDPP